VSVVVFPYHRISQRTRSLTIAVLSPIDPYSIQLATLNRLVIKLTSNPSWPTSVIQGEHASKVNPETSMLVLESYHYFVHVFLSTYQSFVKPSTSKE
jgi:hypothetical protein